MSTFIIARLTFQEASRRKILLAALLMGVVFLIIYAVGFYEIIHNMVDVNVLQHTEVSNLLLMAGLYVVNFLTAMMTVLTSVDTISGEISSGTIHTVVAKPIQRWEVIAGKWLGFAGMLTLYLLLMAGGAILVVYAIAGYLPPHPVQGFLLLWLNAMLLLSVSLLGGTFLSTLSNGVLVFGLYGISFIGGWIEQIGGFIRDPLTQVTTQNIGIITSLILPSESLWRRAAYLNQSALVSAIGFSPFSSTSVPSPAMVVYAVLFLVVVFAFTIRLFQRRDL